MPPVCTVGAGVVVAGGVVVTGGVVVFGGEVVSSGVVVTGGVVVDVSVAGSPQPTNKKAHNKKIIRDKYNFFILPPGKNISQVRNLIIFVWENIYVCA